MRYLFILLLFCSSVLAQTPIPIDYNKWKTSDTTFQVKLGGALSNYPDTDSTFAKIENDYVAEGDSVYVCNTSILKTRINDKGVATVSIKWNGTTYAVRQIPRKLIWINTQTKNWTDVIPNLSWSEPAKDSNVVKWNFPGFDYSLIKKNGQVDYQINFKNAFLDSAITLYNQRADSQYIALGNVHEYTFTNIDDSILIDIAEVNMKRLKTLGKYTFDLSRQNLQWNGSDTSTTVPVKQRWIKVNGKIYCVEFVMMSNIKKVHENYPTSNIWHNSTVNWGAGSDEADKDSQIQDNDVNTNFGSSFDLGVRDQSTTLGRIRALVWWDDILTELDGATISEALLSLKLHYASSATMEITVQGVKRSWVESEVTWNKASSSVSWTTAGCGDATNDLTSFTFYGGSLVAGDTVGHENRNVWDVTTLLQDEFSDINGFLLHPIEDSDPYQTTIYRSSEYTTASHRPKFTATYTTGSTTPTSQIIIISGD